MENRGKLIEAIRDWHIKISKRKSVKLRNSLRSGNVLIKGKDNIRINIETLKSILKPKKKGCDTNFVIIQRGVPVKRAKIMYVKFSSTLILGKMGNNTRTYYKSVFQSHPTLTDTDDK